jgi:acylphosphatase
MKESKKGSARVHIIVKGWVQGVFFRYETQKTATSLGLVGWVRNLRNGSVEVLAEGPKDKLEEMIAWCRHGPAMARVENAEVSWQSPTGEYYAFKVERTT